MNCFKYLLIIEKTNIKLDININIYLINGGESGIRTHGTFEGTHTFQACALNHSAISPNTISIMILTEGKTEYSFQIHKPIYFSP